MARIRVSIMHPTGDRKTLVEVPDDVELSKIIPVLVDRMNFPREQAGRPINYRLDSRRTGHRLDNDETLSGAQIEANDVLTLLPEVVAGGVVRG